MNKVAIAFHTKDRTEQVKRVVQPLLQPDKFDLFWMDGSQTDAGKIAPYDLAPKAHKIYSNCVGGPDYAAIFSLSKLLSCDPEYTHVGICEDDVLMHQDWFGPTMALFERGKEEGLEVGAVSARAYDDRILIQRDGYAVMHNLGYGMIILTRAAARCFLDRFRTGFTGENRRVFSRLSGLDIGKWWAFRESNHEICTDWGLEKFLAMKGYAALALTPSPIEMLGQNPPLHEQGLRVNDQPYALLWSTDAFDRFCTMTQLVREANISLGCSGAQMRLDNGEHHIYPHLIPRLRGSWFRKDEWRLKWNFGMGPFAFRAIKPATIAFRIAGPCMIAMGGAEKPARVVVTDCESGARNEYALADQNSNQVLEASLNPRSAVAYRDVHIRVTAGTTIYRVRCLEEQIMYNSSFTLDDLPLPEET